MEKIITKEEFEDFMKQYKIEFKKMYFIVGEDYDIENIECLSQLAFNQIPKFDFIYSYYIPKCEFWGNIGDVTENYYEEEFIEHFNLNGVDEYHINFYDDIF